ncbi:MAG: TIGR02266 family protein [Deltaproteobacteria bacterium]|nr:MAG: TIGR02266 family protein [Deltaproteobacteria bacterium]
MLQPSGPGKDADLYPIASEEIYKDGQIIVEEGSSGDWVYVVLSGSVEISRTIDGKKFILTVLKPGEVFGELGYLGAVKRTATVRAIGETTIGVIDRAFLDKEFNKLSGYFRSILVALVKRFRGLMDRACEFTGRKDGRFEKTLSLMFKDRQSFIKAYTANIGMGGLFISTEHLLKEGEQFLLKLQLPGVSEPLKVKCEVVWTRKQSDTEKRPPGMGVKFCEMTKKDLQILNQYLQL